MPLILIFGFQDLKNDKQLNKELKSIWQCITKLSSAPTSMQLITIFMALQLGAHKKINIYFNK